MKKMSKEIERKFLINDWSWILNGSNHVIDKRIEIEQAYIGDNIRIRRIVRINNEYVKKAYLTIKTQEDNPLVREEKEYEIPFDYASEILALHPDRMIGKNRYVFDYKGKTWEADTFYGSNNGLSMIEIELKSVNEKFELPPGIGREATGIDRYYNRSLAKHPYKNWSEDERGQKQTTK
jgi:adenylate cyclase